jgi:hypothetical protein
MLRRTRTLLRRLTGSGDERRAHQRHRLDVDTVCRALADDADMPARIRNVSRSGINLTVPKSVPEGTMIRVNLPAAPDGPHTSVLACVTNIHVYSEGLWSLGCVFSLELSDGEMRQFGGEKTPSKPSDQRAWVRYPTKGPIAYRALTGDDEPSRSAELIDLAPAGVGLLVADRLEPGTAITVNLRRQNDRPDRTVLACVVYLADRGDGKWAIGCNFLHELSEKDLNELVWRSTP